MSSGFYTPSPGMIYPALTYLEEIGYATVELEGSKSATLFRRRPCASGREPRTLDTAVRAS